MIEKEKDEENGYEVIQAKKDENAVPEKLEEKETKEEPAVDPNFMASVLLNLPGLDPSSPEVQVFLSLCQLRV